MIPSEDPTLGRVRAEVKTESGRCWLTDSPREIVHVVMGRGTGTKVSWKIDRSRCLSFSTRKTFRPWEL